MFDEFHFQGGLITGGPYPISPSLSTVRYAPTLTLPDDEASFLEGFPLLEWTTQDYPVSYIIQVDRFSNFSTTHQVTSSIQNYNSGLLGESFGHTYYWRVQSVYGEDDISDFSDTRSFDVINAS